jgi:hypothetical protein
MLSLWLDIGVEGFISPGVSGVISTFLGGSGESSFLTLGDIFPSMFIRPKPSGRGAETGGPELEDPRKDGGIGPGSSDPLKEAGISPACPKSSPLLVAGVACFSSPWGCFLSVSLGARPSPAGGGVDFLTGFLSQNPVDSDGVWAKRRILPETRGKLSVLKPFTIAIVPSIIAIVPPAKATKILVGFPIRELRGLSMVVNPSWAGDLPPF